MTKKTLFRIIFANQEVVYEIYALSVRESELFGFLEVEGLLFGEQTTLLVDPSEERLKLEFSGVESTFIPMHAVYRIDKVAKQGPAKVRDNVGYNNKISPFPSKGKIKD